MAGVKIVKFHILSLNPIFFHISQRISEKIRFFKFFGAQAVELTCPGVSLVTSFFGDFHEIPLPYRHY